MEVVSLEDSLQLFPCGLAQVKRHPDRSWSGRTLFPAASGVSLEERQPSAAKA